MPDSLPPLDYSVPGSSVHGIFRQEYWCGLPFPSPGNLPNPGIKPASPTLQALPSEPPGKPQSQCSSQITTGIFTKLEPKIFQFVWKHKRPQLAKAFLRKKYGASGINLHDFKLYYKDTIIKTVWYWYKDRNKSLEQNRKPRDKSNF